MIKQTSRLQHFQKHLRTHQTDAEMKLWYQLRNRNFLGYKFKRQKIIDSYIVDFVCLKYKLVIELDGGQHIDRKNYDEGRTNHLMEKGFFVLRFWNNEVLTNIEGVLNAIKEHLIREEG